MTTVLFSLCSCFWHPNGIAGWGGGGIPTFGLHFLTPSHETWDVGKVGSDPLQMTKMYLWISVLLHPK